MDMTIITNAYNGLRSVKDIIAGLAELKIETGALEKINEAAKHVGEAQEALFKLREELFRIQSDNDTLRKQLADVESWEGKISQYTLTKTNGGAVVFSFNGEPLHYVCPNCAAKKELQYLQEVGMSSGDSTCPSCETSYPIEPPKDMPPIQDTDTYI